MLAAVPDVLLEIDSRGVIERVHGAADRHALLGADRLAGRGILELVPQHSVAALAAALSAARRSAPARELEFELAGALTGLPNIEAHRERLESLAVGGNELPRGVGLLHVDIDHFERINESYGQRIGDAVLRAVALLLRRALLRRRVLDTAAADLGL